MFFQEIHGIWFYEEANCQKLFEIINRVINKLRNGGHDPVLRQAGTGNQNGGHQSNNGEISLADLLTNAGNKE